VLGGAPLDYDAVLGDVRRRDKRDAERSVSPLRQAANAILVDTTILDSDGAFTAALAAIMAKARSPA
jgi:CMP/dCMP kinase